MGGSEGITCSETSSYPQPAPAEAAHASRDGARVLTLARGGEEGLGQHPPVHSSAARPSIKLVPALENSQPKTTQACQLHIGHQAKEAPASVQGLQGATERGAGVCTSPPHLYSIQVWGLGK